MGRRAGGGWLGLFSHENPWGGRRVGFVFTRELWWWAGLGLFSQGNLRGWRVGFVFARKSGERRLAAGGSGRRAENEWTGAAELVRDDVEAHIQVSG